MAYCVFLTDTRLCIFEDDWHPNNYKNVIPNEREVKQNLDKVRYFESWIQVEMYLRKNLSYDDIWLFGLRGLKWLEFGRLYYKATPK